MSRSGAKYLLDGAGGLVLPLVSGGFYPSQVVSAETTAANPTDAQARYTPFWVPGSSASFDRIGINTTVVSAAGGVCRLGIYRDDGAGSPGALVLDAGTVDTTTGPGALSITIAQTLTQGVYWLVAVPQGAPANHATFRAPNNVNAVMASAALPSQPITARISTAGAVAGALPATASVQGPGSTIGILVGLRVA